MKMKSIFFIYPLVIVGIVAMLICSCKKEDDDEPKSWKTLFFDDFNRADGDLGSDYRAAIGVTIRNNKVIDTDEYYAFSYKKEIANDKIKVSAKIITEDIVPTTGGFGFDARSSGEVDAPESYYVALIYVEEGSIGIFKSTTGSDFEELSKKDFVLTSNKIYVLTFEIDGGMLTMNLEDTSTGIIETLTVTDTSPLITGYSGYSGYQLDQDLYVDDFKIEIFE